MEQPVEISQNEYEEPQSPSDVSQLPTETEMESPKKRYGCICILVTSVGSIQF